MEVNSFETRCHLPFLKISGHLLILAYNFVPVGSSGGHGFEAFVVPMGGSNSAPQRIHPHVTTTFGPPMPGSVNNADSSFSTTGELSPLNRMDASVDSDNEMTMMVTRLFQTLSQNPSQPMSEFMRSLGRDFEEPGTCKEFFKIFYGYTFLIFISKTLCSCFFKHY